MQSGRDLELEREWRRRIEAWSVSGQTKKSYCESHGLSLASYYFWRAEIRRRDAKAPIRAMTRGFLPVRVIPTSTVKIKVRCPSGHVVTVTGSDSVTISAVFAALSRDV